MFKFTLFFYVKTQKEEIGMGDNDNDPVIHYIHLYTKPFSVSSKCHDIYSIKNTGDIVLSKWLLYVT